MVGPSKEAQPVVKRSDNTNIFSIVYSVTKKVGTVAIVYLLGYYNISVAWLIGPLILSVVREQWKKKSDSRRLLAQAAAIGLTNEKELITARIDDLPAWVYFPDVERAEWLNRIIRQLWPNINHYTKDLLKNVIEPNVRSALNAYKMQGFQFDRMVLGTIPVRIGGVKVYDRNVSRNEIIMDIDLFYAGDCDISFTLAGFPGGIKDFQIHGMVRVVMKPLIKTIPLVGGLQIFFLNNPSIDFNLVGAIDVLDMPGLSDILRKIIVEQVAALMVLPNKLPIQLSEEVPAQLLKMPEPEGVLRVHVVEAKDLMKMDIGMLGKGKSDPYAVVTVGAQVFRSNVINNSVNPKWDFWCEIPLEMLENTLVEISVNDDDPMADDSCGRATVEISNIAKKGELDVWLTLEEVKHGMVHIRMSWHTLSDDQKYLPLAIAETQQLRVTSMSTALLMVYVDSAKNLPDARSRSRPDPSAILSVAKTTKNTRVIYRTDSPVWEEGFTFLVSNPETDTLTIRIKDQKTENDVGRLEYHLSKLLTLSGHQLDDQPLSLTQSGPESKILISLKLRFLKPHDPAQTEGEKEDGAEESPKTKEPPSSLPKQISRTDSISSSASATSTSTSSKAAPASDDKEVAPPSSETSDEVIKVQSSPVEAQVIQRTTSFTSSAGDAGLGRVQLTLRYSSPRQRLVVVVHRVANLPLKDPSNIPDPYVKLYLLPDRSKETKRKTQVMRDSCNPVYDETFEYVISQGEVNSRTLEITVVTKKTWFLSQNPVMGQVVLALAEIDLTKASTMWFDLQPEKERES